MKPKYIIPIVAIAVLLLSVSAAYANIDSPTSCWDLDSTNQTACESNNFGLDCTWDSWGKFCSTKGCWNFNSQAACQNATDNIAGCTWKTGATMGFQSGWCDQKYMCWNYNNNDSGTGCEGATARNCSWKAPACNGPGSCPTLTTQSACTASLEGCWWDYGSYCYKPGAWDYKTKTSCEAATFKWQSNSYCSQTSCGNYMAQTTCNAHASSGCVWDSTWSYCYKKSCWEYTSNVSGTGCEAGGGSSCYWDSSSSYCYDKSCWMYYNNDSTSGCDANPRGVSSGCLWTGYSYCSQPSCSDYAPWGTYGGTSGNQTGCNASSNCYWDEAEATCKWDSCWNYNNAATCNASRKCQWNSNSSYCEERSCWTYDRTDQNTCEVTTDAFGLDCKWDSTWSYCNKKMCWEYYNNDTTTGCEAKGSNCGWDATGNSCFEKGCWSFNTQANCQNNGCAWSTYYSCSSNLSQAANCWSQTNSGACLTVANNKCSWNTEWSYCYEKGCWDLKSNDSVTGCENANDAVTCSWIEESGGLCTENATKCWDYNTQAGCDGAGCMWDATWSSCYEKGCWQYADANTCNASATCAWTMGQTWGWCEKAGCWNWDGMSGGNAGTCVAGGLANNLTCVWQNPANNWTAGAQDTAGPDGMCFGGPMCWQYETWQGGTQKACNAAGCTWQNQTGFCFEQVKGCANFTIESECMKNGWCVWEWNSSKCSQPSAGIDFTNKNPGCYIFDKNAYECNTTRGCSYSMTTQECSGLETAGIRCENITNQTICNGLTQLSTCCKWQAGICSPDYTSTCWDNMQTPPVANCDAVTVGSGKATCEQLKGFPWYMPCAWDNTTDPAKCSIDFTDMLGTSGDKGFENIKTKKGCEFAGGTWKTDQVCTSNGTNYNKEQKGWCEMGVGMMTKTCDETCFACNSTTTCENSQKGYCVWINDSSHPSGGWCDIPTKMMSLDGDCDSKCAACEAYTSPEQACKKSKNDCKWDNSTNVCIPKSDKTCLEKCFSCGDKDTCTSKGLGKAGACKWDDTEGLCKPKNFDGEICFNGKDDDGNGMMDCADAGCMFDPFCSGGAMGSDQKCWKYTTSNTCAGGGCEWVTDPWTNATWCDMNGSNCWQYDNSVANCNASANCAWKTENFCEVNNTKSTGCFKFTDATTCKANTDCVWQVDQFAPAGQGGWCDYKLFECNWNQTLQSSQTRCEEKSYCKWTIDQWSKIGRCEPVCFARDSNGVQYLNSSTSCNAIAECKWKTGWCEPNASKIMMGSGGAGVGGGFSGAVGMKGSDCALYSSNQTTCTASPACKWHTESFVSGAGTGTGNYGGGSQCNVNQSIPCWNYNNNNSGTGCEAASNNVCRWSVDAWGSWCENRLFSCGPRYNPCTPILNGTGAGAMNCTFNYAGCNADPNCIVEYWTTPPSNSSATCAPKCFNKSATTQALCEAQSIGNCVWSGAGAGTGGTSAGGWCESAMVEKMFKGMEGGMPMELLRDTFESDTNTAVKYENDIEFVGIKDNPDSFGFGIGVRSVTDAAMCNGETDWNGNSMTGKNTARFYWYLDTDGTSTNNCYSHDNAYTGFEFFLSYVAKWGTGGLTETTEAYKCANSNWTKTNLVLTTWKKKMCSELRGGMVAVNKDDLNSFLTLYDATKEMRIYVATAGANTTKTNPVDTAGLAYYMAGKADFKLENCYGFVDGDGDGFLPWEDPDCKFMFFDTASGFAQVEDCYTAWDDDANGLANCADDDCKYDPVCGYTLAVNSSDKTAPSISWSQVDTSNTSANIHYDTDEPANGTVQFYRNDSTCTTLNKSIRDPGLWIGSAAPVTTIFKKSHEAQVDNYTHNDSLGYRLTANTTYYYKAKVCDISGNCGTSGCLNFTTALAAKSGKFKFMFTPPAGNAFMSGMDIELQLGSGAGFAQQGCNCGGGTTTGEEASADSVDTVNMRAAKLNISEPAGFVIWGMAATCSISKDFGSTGLKNGQGTDSTAGINNAVFTSMTHELWTGIYTDCKPDLVTLFTPGCTATTLYHCSNVTSSNALINCTDMSDYVVGSRCVTAAQNAFGGGAYTEWNVTPSYNTFSAFYAGTPPITPTPTPGDGPSATAAGGAVSSATPLAFGEDGTVTLSLLQGNTLSVGIGDESHTIKVKEIGDSWAVFTIASTPVDITLQVGIPKYIDLTGDSISDIKATLSRIKDKVATVLFVKLEEGFAAASRKAGAEPSTAGASAEKPAPEEAAEKTEAELPQEKVPAWVYFAAIAVIVVIGGAFFYMEKKRKK